MGRKSFPEEVCVQKYREGRAEHCKSLSESHCGYRSERELSVIGAVAAGGGACQVTRYLENHAKE